VVLVVVGLDANAQAYELKVAFGCPCARLRVIGVGVDSSRFSKWSLYKDLEITSSISHDWSGDMV